jgi:hypothetical protein
MGPTGRLTAVLVILGTWASLAAAAVNDDQVKAAIDRGVEYLLNQQKANGLFADSLDFQWDPAGGPIRGAEDSWVMVGLAFAELSMNRDSMKKGVDAIMGLELTQTYAVAPRLIALCRLYHKMDRERKERARVVILRDLAWLYKAQGAEGQWDYATLDGKSSTHWDFSNTQMAVLALSEAVLAGFEPPEGCFLKAQNLYLGAQTADGGWNYGSRHGFQAAADDKEAYGSMTAAAVASLYITRDYLYRGLGCPCVDGRSKLRPNRVDEAINRGLAWLGKEFLTDGNPRVAGQRWLLYWLYSCERVGLAAGLKYFGTHSWYAEGAEYVVRGQRRDGSWAMGGEGLSDTVYAICFLVKGRAPILFNKLQFDGQWDNHPRDVANLVRYVGQQKEQPVQWQVINLAAPVDEWHDAPILYLTAETTIPLADEQKAKLRRFTDMGGTILFEASCGNRSVRTWWEKTCKEVWPEWELKKLDKEHPVYTSDQKITRPLPFIEEMHDGVRSIIFYVPSDISCWWNTSAVSGHREAFDFGTNLYAYASDRRALRARLAEKRPGDESYRGAVIRAGGKNNIAVARVVHGGDYYVGRTYDALGLLARALQERGGLKLTAAGEKKPEELKAAEAQVAHLTGRQGLALSDAEAKALGQYLADGGFLLAEAALGDKRLDASFWPLAKQLGLEMKPILPDHGLLSGQMDGATSYAIKNVKFKPTLMAERIGKQTPELFGLYLGDKLVGVYSPFDLLYAQTGYDAWGNRGYAEEDALAILTNILVFVSSR